MDWRSKAGRCCQENRCHQLKYWLDVLVKSNSYGTTHTTHTYNMVDRAMKEKCLRGCEWIKWSDKKCAYLKVSLAHTHTLGWVRGELPEKDSVAQTQQSPSSKKFFAGSDKLVNEIRTVKSHGHQTLWVRTNDRKGKKKKVAAGLAEKWAEEVAIKKKVNVREFSVARIWRCGRERVYIWNSSSWNDLKCTGVALQCDCANIHQLDTHTHTVQIGRARWSLD